MRRILLVLLMSVFFATATSAQHTQIEGNFIFHPNLNKLANTDGYGGGVELTAGLGEYIKLIQGFSVEKSRVGDGISNFTQRDITLQSSARLYPVEAYYSLRPFVQGGVRARFTRFQSDTVAPLPGDPGRLVAENKFTFASPFIGAGVNYKDYYIAEYNYYLPDFGSKLQSGILSTDDFRLVNGFYRERGHQVKAKGFIPMGKKFSFNPAYTLNRRSYEFRGPENDHQLTFGIAYKFDK